MMDEFLARMNLWVPKVYQLPRVRFEVGLGEGPSRWLEKKHAHGARHEPGMIAAILAILEERFPFRQPPRFFDIGAHYGYFSLLMAHLRPTAEVTAFDMHPAIVEALRQNVMPWHTVVHAVLSDHCREDVTFWISGFNIFEEPAGGWEMLQGDGQAMKARGPNNRGAGFARVSFITLDAYCDLYGAPDLIKIDVEGYQAKTIAGGLKTIEKYRPCIIIELHDPEKLARFGTTNALTVQPLFDLGYTGYWCGNHRERDASFHAVKAMTEQHEKLGIMVFIP